MDDYLTKPLVLKANRRKASMLSDKRSLPYLTLWMPSGCNQRCAYCATKGWELDRDPLDYDELLNIIDDAKRLNVMQININGSGEPLMYPKIIDVVRFIHDRKIDCRISTNGTLITPRVARELYENDVSLVLKLHSIDNPAVHNNMVGKGNSYELVRQGIDNLLDAGFPNTEKDDYYTYTQAGIMTLLARPCCSDIGGVLRFCEQHKFYPMLDDIVVAGEMTREKFMSWRLSEEDRNSVAEMFKKTMSYNVRTDTMDVCGIDVGGIFIGRNGDYYADRQGRCCDALAEEGFGNVRTKPLKEMWTETIKLRKKYRPHLNPDFNKYRSGVCGFTCYGMWLSQLYAIGESNDKTDSRAEGAG